MIEKAQLDSYRALAAKPGHDSVDASKALVALPVLLAEVDELRDVASKLLPLAEHYIEGHKIEPWPSSYFGRKFITELKARAGL